MFRSIRAVVLVRMRTFRGACAGRVLVDPETGGVLVDVELAVEAEVVGVRLQEAA